MTPIMMRRRCVILLLYDGVLCIVFVADQHIVTDEGQLILFL